MVTLRNPSTPGLLQCQFYAERELPKTMRTAFELPGDPFDSNPEISAMGQLYLKENYVFFYRDELHDTGLSC